jgi:hypothetical protein
MANPIATVFNLNGGWVAGGTPGPFISVTGNAISVDMSAFGRPFAAGTVLGSAEITVTFGDDSTYTATLVPGTASNDLIQWSNGTIWARAIPFLTTSLIDLNGRWVSAGTTTPDMTVSVSGRFLSITMPGRTRARGYVVDFADIYVDFRDNAGVTGKLELPNKIQWSNKSVWEKVIPSVTLSWQVGTKTFTVQGRNFPAGLVTVVLDGGDDGTFQLTGFAAADGTFTAPQVIGCADNNPLNVSIFEGSDTTTPVIQTAVLCPQTPV